MGNPRPVDRRKQYVRIADDIRRDIASGQYAVGEALPSVADLAIRFGVAKMTISNAMAALRDEGLIQTRQGSPSVVLSVPGEAGDEAEGRSEEFELISAQLQQLKTVVKRISERMDELDERTKDLGR
ncbi:winged helix-turn-helix domain-containing protein [Actinomadura sp. DC4]|uniref:GntR family transcriptional regulator n=1 Tax=Actinomadura sp. DC4 TaxID=3055069 RepID=UPI0025B0AAB5|nr:winged helix-turn-helix domain-containing protein [Actinomadura sp. DC4]MDN3356121.1 winged helix-turn-helix domain-containing protein [Actinomadura sp. DC4]